MQDTTQNTNVITAEPAVSTSDQKTREIAHFTKKKPKKKKVLLVISLVLVAALAVKMFMPKDSRPTVNVSTLSTGDLTRLVTLNGTVESDAATRIYSTETGTVEEVNVKLGDQVVAGDILCRLNTEDIERSIKIKEISMNNAAQKAAIALSNSQIEYQNLLDDLQTDNYTSIITATQALNSAQREYTDARHDLDDHKDEQEYADDIINELESKMNRARHEWSSAKKAVNTAKTETEKEEAQKELYVKDIEYRTAYDEWEKAYDEYGDDVTQYTKAYREKRLLYNNALENKEQAEREATRKLVQLKNSISTSTIDADMTEDQLEMEKLQNSLSDSTVKAPISGTITAVYALEGMPGNGLLFIIEDTDNLIVKTSVKEYDVASISTGMPAIIKSDATGEREFEGSVLHIAPAASKNEDGKTKSSSNNVEFETDVSLINPDNNLRIGMNVRLNVILEKKEGVLSVPYDSVTTDTEGNSIVYIARADEEGNYTAQSVMVETGMETDFSIEVISEELAEGDLIITDPSIILPGDAIRLSPDAVG